MPLTSHSPSWCCLLLISYIYPFISLVPFFPFTLAPTAQLVQRVANNHKVGLRNQAVEVSAYFSLSTPFFSLSLLFTSSFSSPHTIATRLLSPLFYPYM